MANMRRQLKEPTSLRLIDGGMPAGYRAGMSVGALRAFSDNENARRKDVTDNRGIDAQAASSKYNADQQLAGTNVAAAANRYGSDQQLAGTNVAAAASRYGADQGLAGQKYASSMSSAASMYGSDKASAASIYSSDKGLIGQKYSADAQLRGTAMQSQGNMMMEKYRTDAANNKHLFYAPRDTSMGSNARDSAYIQGMNQQVRSTDFNFNDASQYGGGGFRFKDGGGIDAGQGGVVPGQGKGDKVPAKYEPGEFVVSNDMLDAMPSLRDELHDLRTHVLAQKGMTPEEADAKAIRYGDVRASNGVTRANHQDGDRAAAAAKAAAAEHAHTAAKMEADRAAKAIELQNALREAKGGTTPSTSGSTSGTTPYERDLAARAAAKKANANPTKFTDGLSEEGRAFEKAQKTPQATGAAPVESMYRKTMNAAQANMNSAYEHASGGANPGPTQPVGRVARGAIGAIQGTNKWAGRLGAPIAAGMEGKDVYDVAVDAAAGKSTGIDVATQVAEGTGKLATAGLGAAAGSSLGLSGGAALGALGGPVGAAIGGGLGYLGGGLLGGAVGYVGGEQAIKGLRGVAGVNPDSPDQQINARKPAQTAQTAQTAQQPGWRGRGFDDARDLSKDPSRKSLGSARDFTNELGAVPNKLPSDLREGVIHKTVGPNGNPVYSGRNVGPDAQMVDGKGQTLRSAGGVTTLPKGASPSDTSGADQRLYEGRMAMIKSGDVEGYRYSMMSPEQRGVADAERGKANAEYNERMHERQREKERAEELKHAKMTLGSHSASDEEKEAAFQVIKNQTVYDTNRVTADNARATRISAEAHSTSTLRSQNLAQQRLDLTADRTNRTDDLKTRTEARVAGNEAIRLENEGAKAKQDATTAAATRRTNEIKTMFPDDPAQQAQFSAFMQNFVANKAAAATKQGKHDVAAAILQDDYIMDAEDRQELGDLWNLRKGAKEHSGWWLGAGSNVDSLNPADYTPTGVRSRVMGAGELTTANGSRISINDLNGQEIFGGPGSSDNARMIAKARARQAEKERVMATAASTFK